MSLGKSKLGTAHFLALNDIVSAPKRYSIISLAFFLCLTLMLIPGFAGELIPRSREGEGYALYFLVEDYEDAAGSGALRAERVKLQGEGTEQIAEGLMKKLLEGPTEEGLKSTIPSGTSLLNLELQGRRAVVDLAGGYGSLSGIALTLADYAITLTLTQLSDIQAVEITVRGKGLAYRDQQIFTGRDVLLHTEEDYEGDTQVGAVAAALADGPTGKELQKVFPENLQVRSAWQEDEVCYVNLSSALLEDYPEMDPAAIRQALAAIGRSMSSLESVSETRFLVDGEFVQKYGKVDISEPFD